MSSLLVDKVNEKMKKLDPTVHDSEFDVMYSTGFLHINYLNGTVVHVKDKERNVEFQYNSGGIVDGSTNTIIGPSNSGKSTLCIQIGSSIVKPFIKKGMDAHIYIDDIEGSLPEPRKYFLLGLTEEEFEKHAHLRNTDINTQNVYYQIQSIRDSKVEGKESYKYDTGLYDLHGKRIYKYIPTVYIIDSLPMLLPKDLLDDNELGGSMSASSIAKTNTQLLKKISQLCKEANIILFTINHILDDIQMGFIPKPVQIAGLKQGERLPGGKAAIYLANNMFRVDSGTWLKPDKDYGIDGAIAVMTIIKSRTNVTRKTIPLVFNKSDGKFDEELSYIELLIREGKVSGSGVGMFFPDMPEFKFSKKNFKEKIKTNKELRVSFMTNLYALLETFLSDTKVKEDDLEVCEDMTDIFNEIANRGIPQEYKAA